MTYFPPEHEPGQPVGDVQIPQPPSSAEATTVLANEAIAKTAKETVAKSCISRCISGQDFELLGKRGLQLYSLHAPWSWLYFRLPSDAAEDSGGM